MRDRAFVVVLASFTIMLPSANGARARDRTLEDRVNAQRAIEQVCWNHRTWPNDKPGPKPPLSALMSEEAIRGEVEDYPETSSALEKSWQRPITAQQLQAALACIAEGTRDGETLNELYRALGGDPAVIAETLARQALVDRPIRNWYSADTRCHGALKTGTEMALAACSAADCMRSIGGEYRETTWKRRAEHGADLTAEAHAAGGAEAAFQARVEASHATLAGSSLIVLEGDRWHSLLGRFAASLGGSADSLPLRRPGRLAETADVFVVTALLARRDGEVTAASVTWPKRSFDAWWNSERAAVGIRLSNSTSSNTQPEKPIDEA